MKSKNKTVKCLKRFKDSEMKIKKNNINYTNSNKKLKNLFLKKIK